MLADAVRSEGHRFTKNRMAVFWSMLFVPLLFAVGGAIVLMVTKSKAAEITGRSDITIDMGDTAIKLGEVLTFGATNAANGAMLVFMLVAATTLYAGDYRWESWRLISARNSRVNLILGKVIAFKLVALIGIAMFLAASVVFGLVQGVVFERPFEFSVNGDVAGDVVLLGLLSWVRIVQYAMIALLAAVVTRSLLAALFVPVVIGFVQSFLGGPGLAFLGWESVDWRAQLLLPGLAFDTLKTAINAVPMTPSQPDGVVTKAIFSLALWATVPLIAAIAWFSRQDLSKE